MDELAACLQNHFAGDRKSYGMNRKCMGIGPN